MSYEIPSQWWWKHHRIPRELKLIEDEVTFLGEYLDFYIKGWLRYVIPNLWDVIRFYEVLYGKR